MGCVTPLGVTVEELWERACSADCGVVHISMFDASTWPSSIGAEVRGLDVAGEREKRPTMKGAERNAIFAIVAAEEAFADSGLVESDYDPERFGVYLGAGEGVPDLNPLAASLAATWDGTSVNIPKYLEVSIPRHDAMRELEQEPNMPGGHIAIAFNAQGPNCGCLTACAASNQALGEATELIRHNDAEVMIGGGAHSMLHPLGLTGFGLLTALSTSNDNPRGASRPFDAGRDGFLLGEGAAMLVLEEL